MRTGRGSGVSDTEEEAVVQADGAAARDRTTFEDGSRVEIAPV